MSGRERPAGTVLSAKLNPPTPTPWLVPRHQVRERVRSASSARLILIHAPAGFGKTTAMVQCRDYFAQSEIDTAWLTLDGADNDPSRFLACLDAALTPSTGDTAGKRDARRTKALQSPGDMALAIMERIAARTTAFTLFLDDFECVQAPAVLRLVREMLDHLPRGAQLVIGSRGLPDLGLGRLRARGHLLEIDAACLRFSLDETTEFFLRRRHLALPHEHLSQLQRKTEGWVAALWLASVALERRDGRAEFIARFSGSNQAVADYLAEDVLARQLAPIRDFLLRTSILRHLDAPLCNSLLPGCDSDAILRQLAEANVFLTPIEGQERSYRYHSLFSGFLQAQLAQEMPGEAVRLHRAASQWYEAQGRPVPAIDHALEGRNYEEAVRLLSRYAEALLEQGRMRLLARWFATLPAEYTRRSELLQAIHAWAVCMTSGPREAMALLDQSSCGRTRDPQVLAYVLSLRPMILAMIDRQEEAYALGREALACLPLADNFTGRSLANSMAYAFAVTGQYQESHKLLDAARRGESHACTFNKMYSESVEGLIDLEEGLLRQATARFRIAVSTSHAASGNHTGGNAWAGILYAGTLYEMNALEEARHLLHVYLPLAADIGLADHMILGYTMLSRIAFQQGDIDQVFHCLTELEAMGHRRQLPRVVSSARLERARVLLMQGKAERAKEELERANDPAVWRTVKRLRQPAHDLEYFELAEWRWKIFTGEVKDMTARLTRAISTASAEKRHRRALKLSVLLAIVYRHVGDCGAALTTMTAALKAACSENFMRLILDEGEWAGLLVAMVAEGMRRDRVSRSDPIFSVYLQKLMEAFGLESPADADTDADRGEAADIGTSDISNPISNPLTAKEIRILSLLAHGYSNGALAEKLFVSENTIRAHLRNINGKLNAHNRMEAVSIARRLGVIQ